MSRINALREEKDSAISEVEMKKSDETNRIDAALRNLHLSLEDTDAKIAFLTKKDAIEAMTVEID